MVAGSSGPRGCTGSSWPASDTSKLALYLARIFMRGRSFSHHCSLGILCLREGEGRLSRAWAPHPAGLPPPGPRALTRSLSPSSARPQAGRAGFFCLFPAHRRNRHLQIFFL